MRPLTPPAPAPPAQGSLNDAVRGGVLHSGGPPAGPAAPAAGSGGLLASAHTGSASGTGSAGAGSAGAAGGGAPDLPRALCLLLDVARGMAYLHARNVVHADLKSEGGGRRAAFLLS